MNRRDALKGLALSLAVVSAERGSLGQISPKATDLSVLFHGLWAFWYDQLSPADQSTYGILAFTPSTDHQYWARFKKSHTPLLLGADINYYVTVDSSKKNASPWASGKKHDSGMFLYTSNAGSAPVVQPNLKGSAVRSVWLPYPSEFKCIAYVDGKTKPIFQKSNDYDAVEKYPERWAMMQALHYASANSISLGDGIFTESAAANLHLFAQPTTPMCDDGSHASAAFSSLTQLLRKQGDGALDIGLQVPQPTLNVNTDTPPAGVDPSEVDVSDPCVGKHSHGVQTSSLVDNLENTESANPSNCAGGCAIHILAQP